MAYAGPNSYYSSLPPFQAAFETGLPILTYHKLGPRPRRVRLKGLYLSRKWFAQQLRELKRAGFRAGRLAELPQSLSQPQRSVILSFDDGFANVPEYGGELLAENGFAAIEFLVADRLGGQNDWEVADGEAPARLMSVAQVRDWLAAGHEIGSHTLTHPWLSRLTRAQALEEISASKKKLEDLFGIPVEHFCYPYGDWNPAVRDMVAAAGYRTACTTQAGLNQADTDRLALKRFTARYPSRNLKAIWARWRARLGL